MTDTTLNTMNFVNRIYRFTPWTIDTLKLIALFAMLVDHTNTVFSLHIDALRMIGRLAFPLFAVIWAHNWAMSEHKEHRQKTVNRMWVWAIIAQPFYYYALAHKGWLWYDANILFCFAAASQAALWLKSSNALLALLAALLAYVVIYLTDAREYGIFGMLFLFICYIFYAARMDAVVRLFVGELVLAAAYMLDSHRPYMAIAGVLLPLSAIVAVVLFSKFGKGRYLPSQTFYYAYAGHLAALALAIAFLPI